MALPVTISGVEFPPVNYFCGPFKAPNGQFYVVLRNPSTGRPEVCMATDPTSSFAIQDTSNKPTRPPTSMWATLNGNDLHLVTSTDSEPEIEHHIFRTATDLWDGTIIDQEIENVKNEPANENKSCSIVVRPSDNDIIVLYNGDTDADMGNPYERVDYAFWNGSSWSSVGVQVNGGSAAEDHIGSIAVLGESDAVHFGWNDDTNGDALYRRLNSSNSLGTQGTLQGDDRNPAHRVIPSVYYDDGGVERITFGVTNTIGVTPRIDSVKVDDETIDGTPDAAGRTNNKVENAMSVACLAVDGIGKIVYFLGVDALNGDLYFNSNTDDGGWGTPAVEVTGTVTRVSCNVYPRDGDLKLAFVYDDGGIKYNEKSLTAPTAPAFTAARLPAQNYKIGPVKT